MVEFDLEAAKRIVIGPIENEEAYLEALEKGVCEEETHDEENRYWSSTKIMWYANNNIFKIKMCGGNRHHYWEESFFRIVEDVHFDIEDSYTLKAFCCHLATNGSLKLYRSTDRIDIKTREDALEININGDDVSVCYEKIDNLGEVLDLNNAFEIVVIEKNGAIHPFKLYGESDEETINVDIPDIAFLIVAEKETYADYVFSGVHIYQYVPKIDWEEGENEED